ncbi:hypothetical protein AAG570_011651 [Ranatra chinensis]|uniref:G patch domain-containing protein 11 n=1 Tax=Ranatra chinensis TaxID=642074 RepID=A0ABD0Z3G7_9HEMI
MSGEEEDYMSDTFLLENDVRPGLIHCRILKRTHELSKKKDKIEDEKKQKLTVKSLAEAKLKDGLEKPICSDNKGFNLLRKMGFSPGKGLGKSGEGRLEPVPIKLKNDRVGLGRETVIREISQMMASMKEKRMESCSTENYRAWRREQFTEKQNFKDLSKSQRICFELDTKLVCEKLQLITVYLRGTHFHCIWCGTHYVDDKDLREDCPGPTREDHE